MHIRVLGNELGSSGLGDIVHGPHGHGGRHGHGHGVLEANFLTSVSEHTVHNKGTIELAVRDDLALPRSAREPQQRGRHDGRGEPLISAVLLRDGIDLGQAADVRCQEDSGSVALEHSRVALGKQVLQIARHDRMRVRLELIHGQLCQQYWLLIAGWLAGPLKMRIECCSFR